MTVMPVHCQSLCYISLCASGNVPYASSVAREIHQLLILRIHHDTVERD